MGNFLRNLIRDLYAFFVGHGVTFLMRHLDRDLVTMGLGDIMTFLNVGDKINLKAIPSLVSLCFTSRGTFTGTLTGTSWHSSLGTG